MTGLYCKLYFTATTVGPYRRSVCDYFFTVTLVSLLKVESCIYCSAVALHPLLICPYHGIWAWRGNKPQAFS